MYAVVDFLGYDQTFTDIFETKWNNSGKDDIGSSDIDNQKEEGDADSNALSCWLICRERSPTSDTLLQALEDIMGSSSTSPQYSGLDINLLVGPEGYVLCRAFFCYIIG